MVTVGRKFRDKKLMVGGVATWWSKFHSQTYIISNIGNGFCYHQYIKYNLICKSRVGIEVFSMPRA